MSEQSPSTLLCFLQMYETCAYCSGTSSFGLCYDQRRIKDGENHDLVIEAGGLEPWTNYLILCVPIVCRIICAGHCEELLGAKQGMKLLSERQQSPPGRDCFRESRCPAWQRWYRSQEKREEMLSFWLASSFFLLYAGRGLSPWDGVTYIRGGSFPLS